MYPASYDGVIAVSATTPEGELAPFSNYGPWIDLAAPGVDVLAGWADGTYRKVEGTSFSAPLVSGVAMLARARFPADDAAAIARRLQTGARDAGLIGRDDLFGYGILDALGALGGARPEPARPVPPASLAEPDNVPGQASLSLLGVPSTAALAPGGDVDHFAVDVPAGHDLTAALIPPAGASPSGYVVEVFDPELYSLGVGTVTDAEQAVTVFAPGGRYLVRVRGTTPFVSQEPYRLTLTSTPAPPPVDPPARGERLWVADSTPPDGSWHGSPETVPALRFARPLDPASMADATVTLTDGTSGDPVPGTPGYDGTTNSVVFSPTAPLTPGHAYRMSVTGVRDTDGAELPTADCCLRYGVPATPVDPPPDPLVPVDTPVEEPPNPSARSGYWALGTDGAVHA
ncbi:MAG: S8 family serine peptidase, partial [Acidimicrobiia bacterium]